MGKMYAQHTSLNMYYVPPRVLDILSTFLGEIHVFADCTTWKYGEVVDMERIWVGADQVVR